MRDFNVVLTIAGSDSVAGAGIQADLKSVSACGAYCATAITAITAQNTTGIRGVQIVSDDMVKAQIDAVCSDLAVDTIKLGMLPSVGIVDVVRRAIIDYKIKNVVLDPVMIATSGDMLVADDVANHIIDKLLPLATVITPNIPECEFITGVKINGDSDFVEAAEWFKGRGVRAVLLKSGHFASGSIRDMLFVLDGDIKSYDFVFERINSKNTHGTGCSLSSSIAAYLSQGYDLVSAVERAESYIHDAIKYATYVMGSGHGSIAHFYQLAQE